MGCKVGCSSEFQCSNFGLVHEQPNLFAVSQWRWPALVYVIYCWFWLVYTVTWCILSGAIPYNWYDKEEDRVKWFVYFTNWQYLIITINVIVKAFTATIHEVKRRDGKVPLYETMPWYLKMSWVLQNCCFTAGTVVGLIFWLLLYPAYTAPLHVVDLHTHGITLLYLYTDVFITAIPVRVYHLVHSMIFGVVYVLFTLIYLFAGGSNANNKTYIYNGIVDWLAEPLWSAIYTLALVFVVLPFIHLLHFGLYKLRVVIYSRCTRDSNVDLEMSVVELPKSDV